MKKNEKTGFSVLVPDGESRIALSVLRSLNAATNIKAVVISNNEASPIRYSRHCSTFVYLNEQSEQKKLRKILDVAKNERVDIILPVDIEMIRLLAKHKEEVDQVAPISFLPEVDTFDMVNDKWLFAEWLHKNKIPHPNTFRYKNDGDINEFISSLTFPIIMKPRTGSGGRGIKVFDKPEELAVFLKEKETSEDFIYQNFITGYDIDCSVLCQNGKILAQTVQKSFVLKAQRIGWPVGVEFVKEDALLSIVTEMVSKLSWTGVMHIDLRYDEDLKQFNVIEINPRFWASVEASMFTGVNFPFITCKLILDKQLPQVEMKYKRVVRSNAAIKMFTTRLLKGKREDRRFDNTYLEVIIKDPVPYLYSYWKKIT